MVGWIKRWTAWRVTGHRSYDGDESTSTPSQTAILLRVRYTPNGAERLVYPGDARLLLPVPVRCGTDKRYLVGWANADYELKSDVFVTLLEAGACMKRLTDQERHTAFIEDRMDSMS